jgi:hypothetical protein
MDDEVPESSDARKARLRALRDAPGAPTVQPATQLPSPFQEASVQERAVLSFYSDPLEAFESLRQEGRGAELPEVRQHGGDEPGFADGHGERLPTAFASSRGARGRGGGGGGGGAPQQRPAKLPRQEAPRPQGTMGGHPGGRGGLRDGGHDQRRGNDRRGGGGGLDAYISQSMLEDPWAQLVQRQLQQQQQQQWMPRQVPG